MAIAKMALKNLSRQKRRTVLLGGAIAFGILIITMVSGLSSGLIQSLEINISNLFAGHIFISGTEKTEKGRVVMRIRDDSMLEKAIADLKIPYEFIGKRTQVRQAGLISETNTVYLPFNGLNLGPTGYVHERIAVVQGNLDSFTPGSDSILISEGVAKKLAVQLGERITVQAETVNGQQNVLDFTVRAIYKDPGVAASLAGAYADLEQVNRLVNLGPKDYNVLGVYLKDISQTDFWGDQLYKKLATSNAPLWPHFSSFLDLRKALRDSTWEGTKFALLTLNDELSVIKGLFFALNVTAFSILLVLFFVIMVGITNTYRMVVYERTKEIGTLRALGMQKPQVKRLFLLEALFLGLGGIVIGFILGTLMLFLLSLIDLSSWKDFNILLRNNHLNLAVDLGSFILTTTVVSILTVLAAYFPAKKAGNLTPAEALRSNN